MFNFCSQSSVKLSHILVVLCFSNSKHVILVSEFSGFFSQTAYMSFQYQSSFFFLRQHMCHFIISSMGSFPQTVYISFWFQSSVSFFLSIHVILVSEFFVVVFLRQVMCHLSVGSILFFFFPQTAYVSFQYQSSMLFFFSQTAYVLVQYHCYILCKQFPLSQPVLTYVGCMCATEIMFTVDSTKPSSCITEDKLYLPSYFPYHSQIS